MTSSLPSCCRCRPVAFPTRRLLVVVALLVACGCETGSFRKWKLASASRRMQEQSDQILEDGDLHTAEQLLDRAITYSPEDPEAYWRRASLLSKKGDCDDALAALGVCLKLNPDDPRTYREAAALYLERNELRRARQIVDAGLRVAPSDIDLLWLSSETARLSGDQAGATAALLEATRVDPDNLSLTLLLARQYRDNGQLERAGPLLRHALRDLPARGMDRVKVLVALADVYEREERYADGATALAQAIELEEQAGAVSPGMLTKLAALQNRAGLSERAATTLAQAMDNSRQGQTTGVPVQTASRPREIPPENTKLPGPH